MTCELFRGQSRRCKLAETLLCYVLLPSLVQVMFVAVLYLMKC